MKVFLISLLILISGCQSQKSVISYEPSCKLYDLYDYNHEVPQSEMVNTSFFTNSFIGGDSRVGSLVLYDKLSEAEIIYIESLSLNMINITKVEDNDYTLYEKMSSTDKKNLYLFIGLNEIGMQNFDKWGVKLDELVKNLKELHPDANIYLIQSYTVQNAYGTPKDKIKDKINMVNDKIKEVASNNYIYFLNPDKVLLGDDGFVKSDFVFDGVHFNKNGSIVFEEFLRSHIAGENYVKEICN